jgi:hypothetical protein
VIGLAFWIAVWLIVIVVVGWLVLVVLALWIDSLPIKVPRKELSEEYLARWRVAAHREDIWVAVAGICYASMLVGVIYWTWK